VIVDVVQRWNCGRASYRPAGETIQTSEFSVERIPDDTTAKAFVRQHHYSGSYPAARERFGLYRFGWWLVGVAVFSVPAQPKALDVLPGDRDESIELGRFVLLDSVLANGETWFLARCFEQLRRLGYTGVVSFSDPVQRRDIDGRIIFPGHIGTIYQASNAVYLGCSKPGNRLLLPDGTVLHGRATAKIRKRDQGWRYASEILERHGAEPLTEVENSTLWLARWTETLTRPLRHTGNHKYAWSLRNDKRWRAKQPVRPFPKLNLGQIVMTIG
jgi:hypothetical protein